MATFKPHAVETLVWCQHGKQCGVGRFHESCTMGWARTGSTEELCFKLFFELKRGKRLFLMLGFLPSQPSVWNIRRRKRPAADEMNIQTHGLEFAHRACFFDERQISITDSLLGSAYDSLMVVVLGVGVARSRGYWGQCYKHYFTLCPYLDLNLRDLSPVRDLSDHSELGQPIVYFL